MIGRRSASRVSPDVKLQARALRAGGQPSLAARARKPVSRCSRPPLRQGAVTISMFEVAMFLVSKMNPSHQKGRGAVRDHSQPHAESACSCCAHPHAARARGAGVNPSWSALTPIAACALCPACVSVWAPILAGLGLGFALTESQHTVLLLLAVAVAVAISALRARRIRAWSSFFLTALGGALLLAGHSAGDSTALTGLGVLCSLAGAMRGSWHARTHSYGHTLQSAAAKVEV